MLGSYLAPRAAPSHSGLLRAMDYIHANPAKPIGCPEIAFLAGLSVSQCARQFRRMTGVAPHRYLLRVRVAHVQVLLLESDKDLALIAMDAGFADQSHMTRVFRRLTGTTPGAFREAAAVRREAPTSWPALDVVAGRGSSSPSPAVPVEG